MKSLTTLAALVLLGAPLAAQTPAPPPAPPVIPQLVFEREVYSYPIGGRRDPFRPLTSDSDMGPQLSDLTLTSIVVLGQGGDGIVTLRDTNKKYYRLRRGDSVGNITLINVRRNEVDFRIVEFGMARTESVELKLNKEGA